MAPVKSIVEIKQSPYNTLVGCTAAAVTAAFDSTFYIETDDRVCGIQVMMAGHGLQAGMRADIAGYARTAFNSERTIVAQSVRQNGVGSVEPLGMSNRALGGSRWFYNPTAGSGQRGVIDPYGPNNIGLLVKTTGWVIEPVGGGGFYLDDGSGAVVQVKVPFDVVLPNAGCYVCVTGISSCSDSGLGLTRTLLVRKQGDIQVLL
jgi:hypothetical protein